LNSFPRTFQACAFLAALGQTFLYFFLFPRHSSSVGKRSPWALVINSLASLCGHIPASCITLCRMSLSQKCFLSLNLQHVAGFFRARKVPPGLIRSALHLPFFFFDRSSPCPTYDSRELSLFRKASRKKPRRRAIYPHLLSLPRQVFFNFCLRRPAQNKRYTLSFFPPLLDIRGTIL